MRIIHVCVCWGGGGGGGGGKGSDHHIAVNPQNYDKTRSRATSYPVETLLCEYIHSV